MIEYNVQYEQRIHTHLSGITLIKYTLNLCAFACVAILLSDHIDGDCKIKKIQIKIKIISQGRSECGVFLVDKLINSVFDYYWFLKGIKTHNIVTKAHTDRQKWRIEYVKSIRFIPTLTWILCVRALLEWLSWSQETDTKTNTNWILDRVSWKITCHQRSDVCFFSVCSHFLIII